MSFFPEIPPPYEHQKVTTKFILENLKVFDMSDPGTGKTRSALDAISEYRKDPANGRALVLATKSILGPAWGEDAKEFVPHLDFSIATASNRAKAFEQDVDVYITNHDAATWLLKNVNLLKEKNITAIFIDESTAFKHHTSGRSKAVRALIKALDPEIRVMMSGTPNANNPLHIWHQVFLIDDGEHLGNSFYKFRNAVCHTVPSPFKPQGVDWVPKPDANEAISDILEDITIRHEFEKCVSIPPNVERTVTFALPPKLLKAYKEMKQYAVTELDKGDVSAVNAAVLHTKLLQIASGSVYDEHGDPHLIDKSRYELVADLVEERDQCIVAFLWQHQKEALKAEFEARGITYDVIDGKTKENDRQKIIDDFQGGKTKVILAHPQSAGHGLTLTAGTTTIWSTPLSNAELFIQFNRRIYRSGQKRKTETIVICAEDTIEGSTYLRLSDRVDTQQSMLDLLRTELSQ